jgi:hypothetical protein
VNVIQGDQKIRKKLPIFSKIGQKVAKSKKTKNIYNKAQSLKSSQISEKSPNLVTLMQFLGA